MSVLPQGKKLYLKKNVKIIEELQFSVYNPSQRNMRSSSILCLSWKAVVLDWTNLDLSMLKEVESPRLEQNSSRNTNCELANGVIMNRVRGRWC